MQEELFDQATIDYLKEPMTRLIRLCERARAGNVQTTDDIAQCLEEARARVKEVRDQLRLKKQQPICLMQIFALCSYKDDIDRMELYLNNFTLTQQLKDRCNYLQNQN